MAVLNPDHLFEQATKLSATTRRGAPRQADLRRAVSSAYYGLFHGALAALADEFIGVVERGSPRHRLAYRRVDHGELRRLCERALRPSTTDKYAPFIPVAGWGPDIVAFSAALVTLQEKRHSADYDPSFQPKLSDVRADIKTAESALAKLAAAPAAERKMFLTLLAFAPR